MAYPIIKSVWDNFTESYMKAREARAREERAKELSMREFDANQRSWNEDYRIGDRYTKYIAPSDQYELQDLGRANELGIAGQAGNVAIAKMLSGAKTQFATPKNTALISQRFNNNLVRSVDESDFYNRFTPQQKNDYVMAGGLQRVNSGQQARYVVNQFDSPEQAAIRRNNAEMQHLSSSNSLKSLKNEIDRHSSPAIQNSGIMDSESSSLLNRYPQPTFSKATTTPAAQTPMASMAARQPSGNIPTYEGWIAAKQAKEQIIANSEKMNPSYRDLYLSSRLPELDKAIVFNSNYARY